MDRCTLETTLAKQSAVCIFKWRLTFAKMAERHAKIEEKKEACHPLAARWRYRGETCTYLLGQPGPVVPVELVHTAAAAAAAVSSASSSKCAISDMDASLYDSRPSSFWNGQMSVWVLTSARTAVLRVHVHGSRHFWAFLGTANRVCQSLRCNCDLF